MVEVGRRFIYSIRVFFLSRLLCIFWGSLNSTNFFLGDRNVIGGVAGLTADANSLINFARTAAQSHLLTYNEDIPVELLAQRLCDMKQGYTQFGGTLVSFLLPFLLLVFLSNCSHTHP